MKAFRLGIAVTVAVMLSGCVIYPLGYGYRGGHHGGGYYGGGHYGGGYYGGGYKGHTHRW